MKRSEINRLIEDALKFFQEMHFKLPPLGYLDTGAMEQAGGIVRGSGNESVGMGPHGFWYREFQCGRVAAFHPSKRESATRPEALCGKNHDRPGGTGDPHAFSTGPKMEDIINRGGGNLMIQLYPSDREGGFAKKSFQVSLDGLKRELKPRRLGQVAAGREHHADPWALSPV